MLGLSWWYFIPLIISQYILGKIGNWCKEKNRRIIQLNKWKRSNFKGKHLEIEKLIDEIKFYYSK